jgi:uncharacterized phage protein (TIGR01671 family)
MRDILFRAKRKDNGEWIKGYLCKSGEDFFIIAEDKIHNPIDEFTVGEYTDRADKNGNPIFEGDVIFCDRYNKTFEVKFDAERGFYGENFDRISANEFTDCVIVGNIFEETE